MMMLFGPRARWLTRVVAATAVAAGVVAVTAARAPAARVPAARALAAAGHGYVRLAHLSPATGPVDVYLYSFGSPRAAVVLRHVAYGDVSAYRRVAAGEYTAAVRGAGARPRSAPVVSATLDVMAGGAYTVAGLGPPRALRLQVLHDRRTAPAGKALVRVIQASLRQPRVTVRLGRRVLARSLALGNFTGYHTITPGIVTVRVAGPTQAATETEHLAASGIYTLVILDTPGHLAIDCLTEAMGSKVTPAGAPPMGLGGTAGRPGWPLAPWLATGAAGLALLAGGYVRIRRPRRPAG